MHALDVRVSGGFDIAMLATVQEQRAYLNENGVPLEGHAHGVYTEVDTPRRLAWRSRIDFVPGVTPYEVTASIDLRPSVDGATEMTLCSDRMHDAMWTRNAEMGWTQQIDGLVAQLA